MACQVPLTTRFSRQEYWSGLPFPLLGDLPDPGIEPRSSAMQADSLPSQPPGKPKLGWCPEIGMNWELSLRYLESEDKWGKDVFE